MICILPPILTLPLGVDMFECPPSMRYSSLSTHKAIIYYGTITKCLAAVVVIVVSLYVLYVLKRISNQVLPLIFLSRFVLRPIFLLIWKYLIMIAANRPADMERLDSDHGQLSS